MQHIIARRIVIGLSFVILLAATLFALYRSAT